MECSVVFLVLVGLLVLAVWLKVRSGSVTPSLSFESPPEPQPALQSASLPPPAPRQSAPPAPTAPIRAKPRCEGDRFWVPASQTATLGSRSIGGMVYVGQKMSAVSEWAGIEPALIDPRQPVSWGNPDRAGQLMSYWPSYSRIEPASRAAFAEWLIRGRSDPDAYVGYVFLYFYGIERRVLVDAKQSDLAREEVDGLLAEVERLRKVYPGNRSLQGYAASFLSVARLLHRPFRIEELEPPLAGRGLEMPLALKIALGAFASTGQPVPPEWALSWTLTSPEISLRTPARRCPEEFRELFRIRYAEAGGLTLKANKARISAQYRPASPTFGGPLALTLPDLPDVTVLKAPVRKLQEIAERVCQDLDVYSRWVGRTSDGSSPAAIALLPPELAQGRDSEASLRFAAWVEASLAGAGSAAVPCEDLFAQWPLQTPGRVARRDLEMLSGFLARRGYGLEPDVRFGGPVAKQGHAVLFRLPEAGLDPAGEPSPAYHAAAVLLHLAATLSGADGEVTREEELHLLTHLERALHLSVAERARLQAHLRWLLADPPGMAGLKKRIEPLPESRRHSIGQFLITVAGADGHVSAKEIKLLSKIYSLLGLDPQAVYSDIHTLAAADAPPPAEPVTVRPATAASGGFSLPKEPARASGLTLDPRKVEAKLAETEQVASLLEQIFLEEDPAAARPAMVPPVGTAAAEPAGETVAGLDVAHSTLLRELAARPSWERIEVERLAASFALLPDGALEVLNEAAYARCGAPLLEGDEIIEIEPEILEEMLA